MLMTLTSKLMSPHAYDIEVCMPSCTPLYSPRPSKVLSTGFSFWKTWIVSEWGYEGLGLPVLVWP
jgi:hypothetical protein